MGILDIFKSNQNTKSPMDEKLKKLEENCGISFSVEIKDDKLSNNEKLKYLYTDVECTVIGNLVGMQTGAVLYVRKDGVLSNVCSENILQINNKKIRDMINDFFNEDKFSTLRAKFVSWNDNSALINIGFYINTSIEDEENEEYEDYED